MNFLKPLLAFSLICVPIVSWADQIEIDVHGMTCVFCVHSLEKNLGKLDHVDKVKVSLKHKKIRLHTTNDNPDIELIKNTIIDSGFTPVAVIRRPDAQ